MKESTKAIPPRVEAVLPRAIPPRRDLAQANWKKIDDLFYRTIGHAETAFKVNLIINIIIVAIGITLIAYSIAYSWTKSLDIYGTAFGTLGVVSFVATFYLTPQSKIQEAIGNLTQIQMCYRTYAAQWEDINDYLYYHEKEMSLDELEKINNQLETLTCKSVEEIQKFEKKEATQDTAKQTEKKPNAL
jgi:hypothetical protein